MKERFVLEVLNTDTMVQLIYRKRWFIFQFKGSNTNVIIKWGCTFDTLYNNYVSKSTKILKSYLIRGVLKLKQKQTEEADTVTNTEPYLKDC